MLPLLVLFATLLLFTAAAAYSDLRSGEIPNRLIAIALFLAIPLHASVHYFSMSGASTLDVMGTALTYYGLGLVGCGLAPLILFYFDAMGGGDVKLLAAVGAFVGPTIGLEIQLYAFVLMALYAGARLAYRGQLLRLLASSAALFANPFLPKSKRRPVRAELMTSLRFAPSVFVATLLIAGLHTGFSRWGIE